MSFADYPLYALMFLGDHVEFLVGYAVCVLFPIPWVNSWIIDLWAKLLKRSPETPSNN